ncbi:hypothetical protein [Streptomyces tsukubensis]|uniref:WXG100 family type VII secretion target n=1 Tax=Streptomyces tsukubensis TaxID=83656 RepID=A0A1V4ADQ1_9ACTN|nr:hypothetical protein [Streptomyces tsukubensis]OON81685.1 hypothetical protein B1H18_05910 [Streptomyces tsukubensis]QFR96460.1 hypothetical protein GBW32_29750 [Streptomyces tsukubensis]
MAGEYAANVSGVMAGSKHMDDAVRGAEELGPRFETNWDMTEGWWGEEGSDDFADQIGPQCREEKERVVRTAKDIVAGFLALVDAVAQEAVNVQRPQFQALEDIQTQHVESETRR